MATPQELLTETLNNLIEKIDTTTATWIKPWKNTFPMNHITKRPYSGLNTWILWAIAQDRNYETNNWLSFKQITERGGRVVKGEKSTPVFFFKPIQITERDDETGELKTKTIPLLKTYNIFNLSQTDLPIEAFTETALIPSVDEFVENCGVDIIQDTFAYYLPSRHVIGMPPKDSFTSTEGYYSTLLHELAHSTGNALNRDMTGKFGSPSYQVEELVAETTKVFLSVYMEIENKDSQHFEQSAAYLKSWLKGASSKDLFKIFSQAQKAYDYLLSLQNEEEQAA
ncbi:MAG: ArdC-like ssDNA-binding domain-containing protein [Sulfuricurvum sp.]|jgi:antirestriction protein ArdC|uniref:ArdC family protein n=1 Tax=Sulfuricurvum sp. TaxID=2025608 RepID=UPI0025F9C47E|nr:ArdC-like ssDNA-binding domain-containing protein [Sulfuricurvum sp.]MCK9372468.1 ArdC-like ssDNA-binding domain-containing protein [Sulfuricurvum sp.]